jgi:flagellar hook-basal body complex protein FliE
MHMQVMPSIKGITPEAAQGEMPSVGPASQKGNLFQDILKEVNGQQSQADTQVRGSLLGESDLHEAMLALEKANLSLRVLVQVRNKLVQAYEELSRMPL